MSDFYDEEEFSTPSFAIAIDGPAGAGKSTIARMLADEIGAYYLDTGAMYRAATRYVLDQGIDPSDTDAVAEAIEEMPLDWDDEDPELRTAEVTANVSAVAANPVVREVLVDLQREIAASSAKCILDGRDIGTVVLPDAKVKIFLTASDRVRAKRRFDQNPQGMTFDEVLRDVQRRDHLDSTRETSPLKPAEDAIIVDTSKLSLEQVMHRLIDIIEGEHVKEALCTVAIVGRPNVGKSTLVNRILGRREAVVEDFPGVTRDRISYMAEWNGRRFWVQDTGGWDPDAKGIHAAIARQAETAMDTADVIVFVVDTKVGITETDEVMARRLQRADVPVIVVANKFDSDNQYAELAEFYALGLGDPFPVSAQHGRGGADVLDTVVNAFPEVPRHATITEGPRRVALVGKPNVGKSSLLNKITGENRSVVDNVAGTTVDPVDSLVQLDKKLWKFIDTAGLRKKVKNAQGHEFYASLRTKGAIDAAEVCVFIIDASEPVSEQDQRVLRMVIESGKALVVVFNKWDLVDEDRREMLDREIEQQLAHIPWARRVNISAMTGRAVQKIEPAMIEALESWDKRVTTGQLNNWLRQVIAQNPPPMRGGRLPRVLFATQASTRPPVIVLFTTGFLEAGYRRYLERKFRETFGFEGSPVRIAVRVREKRARK
ncbi:MAG: ribosome biogenesis GTPase Der [Corynebacterium sp.]|nr:ribosome biogenesis GTPase Der [Corynebacterium sp.]